MGDLEKVIARWNAFTDDNDADTGYQAWLLMPDFVSGDHAGWDIGWLGGRPSGADMGKSLDIWHTKGGELQRAFADVVTCAAHMNYAVMPMREAGGEPPHWVFVPAYGAPVDADYDFKWVTGYRDYAAFGEDWDAYANEGG